MPATATTSAPVGHQRPEPLPTSTQLGGSELRLPGRSAWDHVGDADPPAAQGVAVSSVMPADGSTACASTPARSEFRGVEPVAGAGEWVWVAAVQSPGLMPTNSSRSR